MVIKKVYPGCRLFVLSLHLQIDKDKVIHSVTDMSVVGLSHTGFITCLASICYQREDGITFFFLSYLQNGNF